MGHVVSLIGYAPSPRFDGTPWTEARIEEASASTGPFAQIDAITLNPVDADPTNPVTRDLTTDNAVLETGWYRIVFADAAGDTQPTEPVRNAGNIYLPSMALVGSILRARTVDSNGNELGTFTSGTRPMAAAVVSLMEQASRDVEAQLGSSPAAPETREMGRHLVALKTAMLIEISYFPESVGTGHSPYEQLRQMFEDEMKRALLFEQSGGDEPGADEGSGLTVHSFPANFDAYGRPTMIGMSTQW